MFVAILGPVLLLSRSHNGLVAPPGQLRVTHLLVQRIAPRVRLRVESVVVQLLLDVPLRRLLNRIYLEDAKEGTKEAESTVLLSFCG